MTAEVSIVLSAAKNALTVPVSALGKKQEDGRYKVTVITGADGKKESRIVKTGINNNILVEVTDGLREGEQVLTGEANAEDSESAMPRRLQGRPMGM